MGRNKAAPEQRRVKMKTNPLPNDLAGLVATAEALAAVLAERQEELGISSDLEALLRASIAAAQRREAFKDTDSYIRSLKSTSVIRTLRSLRKHLLGRAIVRGGKH
jgi:hypothetical protein